MRAPAASAQPETLKVKVLRAFYYHGKVIPAKAEVELPSLLARELQAAKKAEIVKAPEPAASRPEAKAETKTEARTDSKADGGKGGRLV